jgi:hypothetical protein
LSLYYPLYLLLRRVAEEVAAVEEEAAARPEAVRREVLQEQRPLEQAPALAVLLLG